MPLWKMKIYFICFYKNTIWKRSYSRKDNGKNNQIRSFWILKTQFVSNTLNASNGSIWSINPRFEVLQNHSSWKKESKSPISSWACLVFAWDGRDVFVGFSWLLCDISTSFLMSRPPPRSFWLSVKYWLGWLRENPASSTCNKQQSLVMCICF